MEPRLGDVPPVTEPPLEIPPQLAEDFAKVKATLTRIQDAVDNYRASTNPERFNILLDQALIPLFTNLGGLYIAAHALPENASNKALIARLTEIKNSFKTLVQSTNDASAEANMGVLNELASLVELPVHSSIAESAPSVEADVAVKDVVVAPPESGTNSPAPVRSWSEILADIDAHPVDAGVVSESPTVDEVLELASRARAELAEHSLGDTLTGPEEELHPKAGAADQAHSETALEPEHPSVEWTEQLDAALQSLAPLPDPEQVQPVSTERPEEENWAKVEVSNEVRERMGLAVEAATQAQKLLNSYNKLVQEPNPNQDELNNIWSAIGIQLEQLDAAIAKTLDAKEIPTERINDYLTWLHREVREVYNQGGAIPGLSTKLNNIAQATNYVYAALSPEGATDSGSTPILAEPILPGMPDATDTESTKEPGVPAMATNNAAEQNQSREKTPDEFTVTQEQGKLLAGLFASLNDFKKTFDAFVEAKNTIDSTYGDTIPAEQKGNINALYKILRDKGFEVKNLIASLLDGLEATNNRNLCSALIPAEQLIFELDRDGIRDTSNEAIAEYEDKLNRAADIYRSVMARKINIADSVQDVPPVADTEFEAVEPGTPENLPQTPEQMMAHLKALNQAVDECDKDLTQKSLEKGTKVLSMINGAIDKYKNMPRAVKWGITAAIIGGSVTVSMVSAGMPFWGALGVVLTKKAFNVVAGTAVGFTASKIIEKSIDMGMDAATKKWKPWFDKYPEATKFVRELRGVVGTTVGIGAGIWAAGLTPSGSDIVQFTSKVGDSVPNVPSFGLDEAARGITDKLSDQFDGPAGTGDAGAESTDAAASAEKAATVDTTATTDTAKADADPKATEPKPAAAAVTPAEKTDTATDTAKADAVAKTTAPTDATASTAEKAAAAVVKAADAASTEVPSSAIAPETVEKGDTVWAMIREDMETRPELKDAFNALTPEEQNVAIDRIENRLQALSSAEVQELGIKSGDLDLIREGEIVDLEKAIDASDLKDAVEGKTVEVPATTPAEAAPAAAEPTAAATTVEKPPTAAVVTEPAVPKAAASTVPEPAPEAAPAPVPETTAAPKPPEAVSGPEAGWTNIQTQNVMTSLVNHFVEQPKGGFLSGLFGAGVDDAAAVSWLYGGAGEPTGINGTTIANLMSDKPEGPYTSQAVTSMTALLETILKGTGIDLNAANWQSATVEEVTQAALSKGMELKTPWFTEFLNSADARGVRTLLGG